MPLCSHDNPSEVVVAKKQQDLSPEQVTAWQHLFVACLKIMSQTAARFGMPMAILMLSLVVIWIFSSKATLDEFARMLLFTDDTHQSQGWVRAYFVGLIVLILGHPFVAWFKKKAESREVDRLRRKVSQLQEKLLAAGLSLEEPAKSEGGLAPQSAGKSTVPVA